MSIFDRFRVKENTSANIARERLQIVVAHQRNKDKQPSYLPQLQREILAVIKKFVDVDMDDVAVDISQENMTSILEVNVTLPS
ncbi:MAG: cell division topological specificity factor MinE [Saccharospirillaceae bacterium]|nr:cell division topological specificity factor MinE [Pseudomonadales bacterium]NRB78114.1 cell division topological specificity factor MinE [Saccharospirillaceae bacterium]